MSRARQGLDADKVDERIDFSVLDVGLYFHQDETRGSGQEKSG